ncbi:helix-turn-helix transcriptional regulator [Rhodopila sp.]|uniref:helix-turn-helix transcriptional regulator n=1 Tax=Rhodopila sp. TaxID=2480087 RepID=UPI003D10156B
MQSTSDQLLFELKTRGPATTRDLAARARITRQAAREHLTKLAGAKLVDHTRTATGVGRPGHKWSLTEKGHGRFPDTHAQMTVELIETIRGEFGEAGLTRMLARREQTMAEKYEQALRGAETLEQRLAGLVRLRSAEGYMADASYLDDGTYVMVENHCPICAAAAACQGFCRSELALFARLLAPAQVERAEHLLAGCRRCCYVVTPGGQGH